MLKSVQKNKTLKSLPCNAYSPFWFDIPFAYEQNFSAWNPVRDSASGYWEVVWKLISYNW